MPQYMLLIYAPAEGGPSPEELQAEMPAWFQITEELRQSGALVAGEALEPTASARTVRVRSGERQVSAAPFATTEEVLTGFYIVDVDGIGAAEEWAARLPNAPYGSVEVRPIMVFPDSEPATAEQAATGA
jgi:hypothetical protein